MTSKISLFNCGIYKSTVRRYIWGAVLYAILLFMTTSMSILLGVDPESSWRTMDEYGAMILNEAYLYVPVVISIVVPTVVALLVYRFVHSKKTSIFVHSLPVSRGTNYISTLLASFTLMAAPIILNGIILIALSVTAYGAFFDVVSCLIWMGVNLLCVFLMFSVSTLAAFLTGNSFAMVALNGLLHSIAPIIAGSLASLADVFLYGYYETNVLIDASAEWNFVAYIASTANRLGYSGEVPFSWAKLCIMLALALVCYVAAFLLYKKRRIETAEDVAAYKCLNPIYKYLLTFLAALACFGIFGNSLGRGDYAAVVIMLIVSAVVYFASEMILKKSLKIWKSYKGYLVFLAAFAVLLCGFAFTDFFGYETNVPHASDIESVAIYEPSAFNREPVVENREIIDYVLGVHTQLVDKENIYTLAADRPSEREEDLYISYKLKGGGTVVRRYPVTPEMLCETMDWLYQSHDYKRKNLEMFSDKIERVYSANINHESVWIRDEALATELLECVRADLLDLEYTRTKDHSAWDVIVGFEYARADEMQDDEDSRRVYYMQQSINANFTRTVAWLREHGYQDKLFNERDLDLTVLTAEQLEKYNRDETVTEIRGKSNATVSVSRMHSFEDIPGAVRISDAQAKARIRDFVLSTPVRYVPGKEYSCVVYSIDAQDRLSTLAAFYDDTDVTQLIS